MLGIPHPMGLDLRATAHEEEESREVTQAEVVVSKDPVDTPSTLAAGIMLELRKRSASEAVSPFSPQADEEEEATPPPGAVAGAGEAVGISAHGDFPSPGDPREDSSAGSRRPPKFRLPGSKLESMDENGPVTLTAVPRRTRTVFVLAHVVVMSCCTMFLCTTKGFTCLIA
ncbi:unnamed protein product [Closterium sp. NIES-65]|nr:unnamed protein product [Closterium sp. NIES-65]